MRVKAAKKHDRDDPCTRDAVQRALNEELAQNDHQELVDVVDDHERRRRDHGVENKTRNAQHASQDAREKKRDGDSFIDRHDFRDAPRLSVRHGDQCQYRYGHDVVQIRKPKRSYFRGRVLGDDALDHNLIAGRRDHVDRQPCVSLRVERQVVEAKRDGSSHHAKQSDYGRARNRGPQDHPLERRDGDGSQITNNNERHRADLEQSKHAADKNYHERDNERSPHHQHLAREHGHTTENGWRHARADHEHSNSRRVLQTNDGVGEWELGHDELVYEGEQGTGGAVEAEDKYQAGDRLHARRHWRKMRLPLMRDRVA